ncbi:MAG: energy-coupling factor transporter ATPase [Tissierellia bacterium]|nr:energy-coupling factor transporter ATPase [Tissierellia bacterium]
MSRIEVKELNYIYSPGMPFQKQALFDVNLTIESGEFVGLIGHTGSGKSTLVQNLNGLVVPTSGEILVDGINYQREKGKLSQLRQKVGLVFQYPEYQLFEETVNLDVAFGPKNLGLSKEEVDQRVARALKQVGLNQEEVGEKSPFELSGGQKRRVAIAGILAMEPEVLVLDEPTAGLDPHGSKEILDELREIFKSTDTAIVLVSHSMEEVARLATRIVVMSEGRVQMDGPPREVFQEEKRLRSMGLDVPQVKSAINDLRERGLELDDAITVEEAAESILALWEAKNV